jgi:hypothetical protein
MMKASRRKFTLLDVMIMVAAGAVSVFLTRIHREQLIRGNAYEWTGDHIPWSKAWLVSYAWWVKGWTFCWLVPCSWAFLLIRIRRPRPPLTHLLLQPGMAALGPTCLLMMLAGALSLAKTALSPPSPTFLYIGYRLNLLTEQGGLAAAAAWLLLTFTGRCRPESSWIDRAGAALGACWIASWLSSFISMVLDAT